LALKGLVDREPELERLLALVDAAATGRGSLMLVEGPAGIGKTRLLAAGQNFAVVGSSAAIALAVGDLNNDARADVVLVERHPMPATPNEITVLTSIPPVVGPPPPGGGSTLPSPATGIQTLKSKLTPNAKGKLFVGQATNPPTLKTVQTLTAKGKLLGRGKTTIAAGRDRAAGAEAQAPRAQAAQAPRCARS
jgi:hypothetical protein